MSSVPLQPVRPRSATGEVTSHAWPEGVAACAGAPPGAAEPLEERDDGGRASIWMTWSRSPTSMARSRVLVEAITQLRASAKACSERRRSSAGREACDRNVVTPLPRSIAPSSSRFWRTRRTPAPAGHTADAGRRAGRAARRGCRRRRALHHAQHAVAAAGGARTGGVAACAING